MSTGFFGDIKPAKYEGPDSANPLAYRFYNKDEVVAGKRMEDHLRFAVAYWHSFAWPGGDPFGGQTFERPWFGDTMQAAKLKADVAFEMFSPAGRAVITASTTPTCAPKGKNFAESAATPRRDRRHLREEAGRDRRKAARGARRTCSPTAASWRAPPPIPIRTFSLYRRGHREAAASTPPNGSAARTMCCGAAARATRPCSTPT